VKKAHDKENELIEIRVKDTAEGEEFFTPENGLELEPYLARYKNCVPSEARRLKQAIHHLARYHWAARVISESNARRVLDVACGAGYGSYVIAMANPDVQVVGGDYDPRAILHAEEAYGSLENLTFQTMDICTWASEGSPLNSHFDAITSFDTLEHLNFREIALINMAENLDADGFLLLSTPCGHRQNQLNPPWEHHKIEYSHRYLVNLMRRFFQVVQVPDDGSLPELGFWQDVVNNEPGTYLNRANPIFASNPISYGL